MSRTVIEELEAAVAGCGETQGWRGIEFALQDAMAVYPINEVARAIHRGTQELTKS